MANAQELYKEAIKALDAKKTEEGIALLKQSLELDGFNLYGWLKLAEVMPDNDEKFDVLEQILQLDPNNQYANKEWDRLNAKANSGEAEGEDGEAGDGEGSEAGTKGRSLPKLDINLLRLDDDLVTGVKRREAFIVIGGLLLFTLCMCSMSNLIVGMARQQEADQIATVTQQAFEVTGIVLTADADRTQVAMSIEATGAVQTATVMAQITPPTSTPRFDLPTEIPDTPTPTATSANGRISPALPSSVTGTMLAWGGINPASREYLFMYTLDVQNGALTRVGTDAIAYPSADSFWNRVTYLELESRTNTGLPTLVERQDFTAPQRLQLLWVSPGIREEGRTSLAASGNYLIFNAIADTGTRQLFVYDYVQNIVAQITRDSFNYGAATISSNGLQVVAVKEGSGGTDLVLISLSIGGDPETFAQTPLTNDGNRGIEDSPSFSVDSGRVVYEVAQSTSPNDNDVYVYDFALRGAVPVAATAGVNERFGVFSPDGRYVAYASDANGVSNIFAFDTIGKLVFQITTELREPVYPAAWRN